MWKARFAKLQWVLPYLYLRNWSSDFERNLPVPTTMTASASVSATAACISASTEATSTASEAAATSAPASIEGMSSTAVWVAALVDRQCGTEDGD